MSNIQILVGLILFVGCLASTSNAADWDCVSREAYVRCKGSASNITKSGEIDSIVVGSYFRITLDMAGIPLQPVFTNKTNPFYFAFVYDVDLSWYNCIGASCHAAVTVPQEISYTAKSYTIFNALTNPSCREYALSCIQGTIAHFSTTILPGCLNCEFTLNIITAP